MEKNRDEEIATRENTRPIIEKEMRELLSEYKQILLDGLDKLQKERESLNPELTRIFRMVLNDVRKLIKTEKS